MNSPRTAADAAPISRELNEFLLELGLALQRYALYPGGHPSIDTAVEALVGGLGALLRDREMLSLGVARRQLIVEGVATEDSHPVLRTVAERLHRHRVGVVTFRRGLTREELISALRSVSREPEQTSEMLGLLPADRQAEWPHVRFHSLAYDHLQLAQEEEGGGDGGGGGGLAAQLWLGLARAALARDQLEGDADPALVARAINEKRDAHAYDQVIVGYMLQLTEQLQAGDEDGTDPVRSRLSQLVRQLEPETLDRLLEMGGDTPQRARFLHGAARGLKSEAVLELVDAAARAEGQTISTSLLRLLRKLATLTRTRTGDGATEADTQLREQVQELLVGWSLADPNPGAYTAALDSMARGSADHDVRTSHPAEPLRLVQMSVELDTSAPATLRAVDELLRGGRLGEIESAVSTLSADSATARAIWGRIAVSDSLRVLLTTDPVDLDEAEPLLKRLPISTVISLLLDRLAESGSRTTQLALSRRLVAIGLPVTPLVVERLGDPRGRVARDLLALLHEIDAWPAGTSALPWLQHEDAAVRREAVVIGSGLASDRDTAIVLALNDADERVLRSGIAAARAHGLPASAVSTALQRVTAHDTASELRVALIRLLAAHADSDEVTSALLPLVLLPRTLLRGPRLAAVTSEMLAALSCLAASRTSDARVQHALTLARASRDPRLIRAARIPTDAATPEPPQPA